MIFRKKLLLHKDISKELQSVINKLKSSKDKESCLNIIYDILVSRYYGQKGFVYIQPQSLFISDVNKLWIKKGAMHCTNINYLMKFLLVESGFFNENDVVQKWTQVWYVSPHQYLRIRVGNNKYINIDIWGKRYGIGFGDFAYGFH